MFESRSDVGHGVAVRGWVKRAASCAHGSWLRARRVRSPKRCDESTAGYEILAGEGFDNSGLTAGGGTSAQRTLAGEGTRDSTVRRRERQFAQTASRRFVALGSPRHVGISTPRRLASRIDDPLGLFGATPLWPRGRQSSRSAPLPRPSRRPRWNLIRGPYGAEPTTSTSVV
jgi:hypothetical protein